MRWSITYSLIVWIVSTAWSPTTPTETRAPAALSGRAAPRAPPRRGGRVDREREPVVPVEPLVEPARGHPDVVLFRLAEPVLDLQVGDLDVDLLHRVGGVCLGALHLRLCDRNGARGVVRLRVEGGRSREVRVIRDRDHAHTCRSPLGPPIRETVYQALD